jgi:hypothetical protein
MQVRTSLAEAVAARKFMEARIEKAEAGERRVRTELEAKAALLSGKYGSLAPDINRPN